MICDSASLPLVGRTALVTGANRGIGAAIATALASAGADLVLVSRSGNAAETEAAIEAQGRRARTLPADLADPFGAAGELARRLEHTPVDILVNNAGFHHFATAAEVGPAAWTSVIDVNLNAVWALSQTFGARMAERGEGSIVTIASLMSRFGGNGVVSYTAAKHAVVGLTKALANEWASRGVRVNALAPGWVETDNTAAARADTRTRARITERIPLGRWATAADLVGPLLFLVSPAASYVHGHTLVVDGGYSGR